MFDVSEPDEPRPVELLRVRRAFHRTTKPLSAAIDPQHLASAVFVDLQSIGLALAERVHTYIRLSLRSGHRLASLADVCVSK